MNAFLSYSDIIYLLKFTGDLNGKRFVHQFISHNESKLVFIENSLSDFFFLTDIRKNNELLYLFI